MNVIVNGEPRDVPQGTTIAALLIELKLDRLACAAEVNRRIVPKREHATHELAEGDRIELVTLVGGG
jgi:sulfur carrier protein